MIEARSQPQDSGRRRRFHNTVVSLSDGSPFTTTIFGSYAMLSALLLGFIESLQWYTSHGVVVEVYDGVPRRPILLEHLGDEIQVILV